MSAAQRPLVRFLVLFAFLAALWMLGGSPPAGAETLPDDGGAEWRLEQPEAPEPPPGVERPSWLVGLGRVGDIEFEAPNRGAMITAGNGSTVSAGVWLYNGQHWRQLATVCGATDGRIAWAGPDDFWTVSDGRPGQAPNSQGVLPPLEDDTLCHFAVNPASHRFEIVASYGHLVGGAAALAFAVALLASGVSSSSVGTYAGQIVMAGFINVKIPVLLRRAVTMLPALIILAIGVNPTTTLIFSQVVLSFGIPFALIPLVALTSRRDVMGTHVNRPLTRLAAWGCACLITGLNIFLISSTVFGV